MKKKTKTHNLGFIHMAETRPADLDSQVRKFAAPRSVDEAVIEIQEEDDERD